MNGEWTEVGSLWDPKAAGSRAMATGYIEVGGKRLRIGLYENKQRPGEAGVKRPRYRLMAAPDSEWEAAPQREDRDAWKSSDRDGNPRRADEEGKRRAAQMDDDDVPF